MFARIAWLSIALVLIGPVSTTVHSASGLTQLTAGGDILNFEWAPQGESLLVTRVSGTVDLSSAKQTYGDLYRVDANGGPLSLLTRNGNHASASPDGRRAAFVSLLGDGSARLRLIDLASRLTVELGGIEWGARPQWILGGAALVFENLSHALSLRPDSGILSQVSSQNVPIDISVSPRGDRFAFSSREGLHLVINEHDSVILPAGPLGRSETGAVWSHDGSRLAFAVSRNGVDAELWVADSTGAVRQILSGKTEFFSGLDWAPDDSNLLFTRTPTGSSASTASDIWRINSDGSGLRALTLNREEESSPRYSPDGKRIAFLREGDLWMIQLDQVSLPLTETRAAAGVQTPSPPVLPSAPRVTAPQLTPPPTIRVYHSQYNTCRSVPVGQIDAIDFETYVKRVVPAEVYASWPAEALKTQAVAARSYAWYWVLQHSASSYDVTDSTSYQYMCDNRYASTDAAVDATRGQYGDYAGSVIFAAYGANNGDPTLASDKPYLASVDDPVGFKAAVSGNGIGMSQWGADYWASAPYNWNYQQILTHYYSGITIQAPAGASPDSTPPIGGMVMPWSKWGVTSNRLYLVTGASDDSGTVSSVSLQATWWNGTTNQTSNLTPTYDGTYWAYVADLSSIPDQAGIVITPRISDNSGNTFSGNGVTLTLDRALPGGAVSAPSSTTTATVTLILNGNDTGPGGLSQMAFSNNWIWEGENQSVTNVSGTPVNDTAALNGHALMGQVGVSPAGEWYGPYTSSLPLGNAYRAYFRVKTDNVTTNQEIALLDVVDNGGQNLLGMKRLRGTDFRAANVYQEAFVDFYFTGIVNQGLEFRVAFRATANLWLDRIIIVSEPIAYATSAQWNLTSGAGSKTIQAKFIDGAGNVSQDTTANIVLAGTPTPTPTLTLTPSPMQTATPPLTPLFYLPFIVR